MNEIKVIDGGKQPSDAEVAAALRREMTELAHPLLAAMTKANRAGFMVQISFGLDYKQEWSIAVLSLAKPY